MAGRNRKLNQPAGGDRGLSAGAKVAIIAAVCLVLAGGLIAGAYFMGWLKSPASAEPDGTAPSTEPKEDTVIHLVSGGDVNVTDKVVASGAKGNGYDYSEIFLDVIPILSGADLTTLNFEGNLYGEPYGSKHNSAPLALVQALRNSGVDILQTANSKTIANGILGLTATLNGIREAGMQPLGTYADTQQFRRYQGFLIQEVQGIKIAFTAFTKGMDGKGLPAGSEDCVNLLYSDYSSAYQKVNEAGIQKVLRAIEEQKPDITIALLHWGSEFNDQISKTQKQICQIMAREGVDAVIGTHPHYVQEIGYDRETGMFIAYSLGDFYGDGDKSGTDYSILLDLEITRNGKSGQVRISGYSYTPIYRYEDAEGNVRLLRIREAMAAYENRYIDAVTEDVYESMKNALARIEDRVEG